MRSQLLLFFLFERPLCLISWLPLLPGIREAKCNHFVRGCQRLIVQWMCITIQPLICSWTCFTFSEKHFFHRSFIHGQRVSELCLHLSLLRSTRGCRAILDNTRTRIETLSHQREKQYIQTLALLWGSSNSLDNCLLARTAKCTMCD